MRRINETGKLQYHKPNRKLKAFLVADLLLVAVLVVMKYR